MNVDTKTLFTVVLVAGIIGGFALNNSLFRDIAGLDDTIEMIPLKEYDNSNLNENTEKYKRRKANLIVDKNKFSEDLNVK